MRNIVLSGCMLVALCSHAVDIRTPIEAHAFQVRDAVVAFIEANPAVTFACVSGALVLAHCTIGASQPEDAPCAHHDIEHQHAVFHEELTPQQCFNAGTGGYTSSPADGASGQAVSAESQPEVSHASDEEQCDAIDTPIAEQPAADEAGIDTSLQDELLHIII